MELVDNWLKGVIGDVHYIALCFYASVGGITGKSFSYKSYLHWGLETLEKGGILSPETNKQTCLT